MSATGMLAMLMLAPILWVMVDRIDIDMSAESTVWCAGTVECLPALAAGLAFPLLAAATARLGWWDDRSWVWPFIIMTLGIPALLLVAWVTEP